MQYRGFSMDFVDFFKGQYTQYTQYTQPIQPAQSIQPTRRLAIPFPGKCSSFGVLHTKHGALNSLCRVLSCLHVSRSATPSDNVFLVCDLQHLWRFILYNLCLASGGGRMQKGAYWPAPLYSIMRTQLFEPCRIRTFNPHYRFYWWYGGS